MADSSFERFFELIPDLLCIASSDGRIVRVNLAFERDLGWSLDDLAGRPFSTLVHPDDVAATQAEVIAPALRQLKVIALQPDLAARGVAGRLVDGITTVDYAGFVDLVATHPNNQSWL